MFRTLTLHACVAGILLVPPLAAMNAAAAPAPQPGEMPVLQTAGAAAIDAPGTVDPGAAVNVTVAGGAPGGRVELWGPVTQSGRGGLIGGVPTSGEPVALTAPTLPGSYELRYISPTGAMLARATLDVAAIPITLSAPRSLGAGVDTAIEWRGPGDPGDLIQVYDPSTGTVLSETPAVGQPGAMNTAVLRGPERIGDFMVRYWSGARHATLRELPVRVDKGDNWLRTPIEVFVGEKFAAEWKGPADSTYVYQVVDPKGDAVIDSQAAGAGPVQLKAPGRPGAYRVRFVNTTTGYVVADLPLDVDPK